jgi:aryl-alcohol dehydrogenase-like predicted oxidoreductase
VQLRQLPGTDIRVSEVSFGAGTAAGLFVNGTRADQLEATRKALELGINHFDTAPIYGFGCSEVNLGAVLQELRADVVVTSKINIPYQYLATDSIGSRIKQSIRESLTRLRRDHIDILLVHNATHFARSPAARSVLGDILPDLSLNDLLGPGGVWETVQQLKAEGLVRYFGVSGQDNNPAAVKALVGAGRIEVFNQPFNLLNPSAGFPGARGGSKVSARFAQEAPAFLDFEDVIEFGREHGVGASVISPLAAGALTEEALAGKPAPPVSDRAARFPQPGQYDRALRLARAFAAVAGQADMTLTELAYRFVLTTPGVTTLVGGFSTTEQVVQAADAASRGPLGQDVLSALNEVWQARSLEPVTAG